MPERGRFITLEGGEAAGKSTQARLLAARLREACYKTVETREPGGTPGAEHLRTLLLGGEVAFTPLAETFLHFAARTDHVERVIQPALEAGTWVICDRFSDSTAAYQGFGQGVDLATIATLRDLVAVPDMTLVLRVEAKTARARLARRGGSDRYERLGQAFFARVRDGFAAIAAADPARCVVIDADGAPDDVAAAIWAVVMERLAP